MKKRNHLAFTHKIWDIAYPVLMYYTAITIGIFFAQMFLGTSNENYMICKIIGSLVAIPVVLGDYRRDLMLSGKYGIKPQFSTDVIKNLLWVAAITLFISVGLNNVICMSPLVEASSEYQNASEAFYGSTIWIELLGSALITPFLEELLHRGVVFGRLRRMMGKWLAIIISALIFAALHFNVVQFVYAFLLGIVFALLVEKTGKLYPAVFAHVFANGLAVIRTETNILSSTVDGSASAWFVSVGAVLIGLGLLMIFYGGKTKRSEEA